MAVSSGGKYPNVGALLKIQGETLVAALERALPPSKDATGELRNSIRFTIKRFGIDYRFELYLADYYEWVDKGRPPGKFPWDKRKGLGDEGNVILQWIKTKGLVIYKGQLQAKKKGKLKRVSDNLKLARKIAYAIGWKIKKYGTKGNNFYSSTVPGWVDNFKRELPKALKRDVVIEIREIAKK